MSYLQHEIPLIDPMPVLTTPEPEITTPSNDAVDQSILTMLSEIQEPGEPDLVSELIGLFLEDAARNLTAIGSAVENRNAAGIRLAAHSLKGSSGSLGAVRVADRCRELESIVPSEGWFEIQQTFVKLKTACAEAVEFFHAELKRRSSCGS